MAIKNIGRKLENKVNTLVRHAELQGWKASVTKKGHVKLISPNHMAVVFLGNNTGDPHCFNNMRSLLRRNGLWIP